MFGILHLHLHPAEACPSRHTQFHAHAALESTLVSCSSCIGQFYNPRSVAKRGKIGVCPPPSTPNRSPSGDTDRVIAHYLDENVRRAAIIEAHREFIGPMTPYLEIGANAGHTSYMLANQFACDGFALDLSADALRHGVALMDRWQLSRAPIRVAGDAVNLPFRDGSMQFVMACQMLSQFMNIESVFLEVKRVLAPGGVFLFTEEPLRRLLSLRLYRAPYPDRMKPWEHKLFDWGLLGYLARDVIGAEQEESFGIRQNHRMDFSDWRRLIARHFAEHRYQTLVPERGWGERMVKRAARNHRSRHPPEPPDGLQRLAPADRQALCRTPLPDLGPRAWLGRAHGQTRRAQ